MNTKVRSAAVAAGRLRASNSRSLMHCSRWDSAKNGELSRRSMSQGGSCKLCRRNTVDSIDEEQIAPHLQSLSLLFARNKCRFNFSGDWNEYSIFQHKG